MSPAWPIAREKEETQTTFASATDMRSLEVAEQRNRSLVAHVKELFALSRWSRGVVGAWREEEEEEAAAAAAAVVVVRPRKEMKYYFTGRLG